MDKRGRTEQNLIPFTKVGVACDRRTDGRPITRHQWRENLDFFLAGIEAVQWRGGDNGQRV